VSNINIVYILLLIGHSVEGSCNAG
jgi:hypothetical protein